MKQFKKYFNCGCCILIMVLVLYVFVRGNRERFINERNTSSSFEQGSLGATRYYGWGMDRDLELTRKQRHRQDRKRRRKLKRFCRKCNSMFNNGSCSISSANTNINLSTQSQNSILDWWKDNCKQIQNTNNYNCKIDNISDLS